MSNIPKETEQFFQNIINQFTALLNAVKNKDNIEVVKLRTSLEELLSSSIDEKNPIINLLQIYKEVLTLEFNSMSFSSDIKKNVYFAYYNNRIENLCTQQIHQKQRDYQFINGHLIPYLYSSSSIYFDARTLIDKINLSSKSEVKVAYFGNLLYTNDVVEYYEKKNKLVVFNKYQLKSENWIYESEDGHMVNLKDGNDLSRLVCEYDFIFILDDASFKRPLQTKKKLKEKNMDHITKKIMALINKTTDIKQKCDYYISVYNIIIKYLNTEENNKMSGSYQFDNSVLKLFNNMVNKYETKCADIYIYDSSNNNDNYISPEEYHNGKLFTVTHLGKHERYKEPAEMGYINVPLWDIIYPLGNKFYCGINRDIDYWKNTYIKINIKDIKEDLFYSKEWEPHKKLTSIQYTLFNKDGSKVSSEIKNIVFHIFDIITNNTNFLGKSLRLYLSCAIRYNADCIEHIVFAFLLKNNINIKYVFNLQMIIYTSNKYKGMTDEERFMAYALIKGLDNIIIREIHLKSQILIYHVRPKFAPTLTPDKFLDYLNEIHMACNKFGFTKSRIYLYTENNSA